jgi:hypothetical protein
LINEQKCGSFEDFFLCSDEVSEAERNDSLTELELVVKNNELYIAQVPFYISLHPNTPVSYEQRDWTTDMVIDKVHFKKV